ncbi:unnamed protein product [Acanthoscelides obtectus]|uniref:N-acetylgalactosaminide beta-1,3-galactosyltransferase n=1 Tax=Acanthoscelides obtectus TaxID=200917 RepID=A0A9P0LGF6_ACAOB|nr:unnamed protein product [Acanthoscelides obtectus]CAK1663880.1 Glycoprotein-N-acetylgalactosamine 3-beta-galactosyltransferase 1 [Acanthoscelides obtectus]
MLPRLCSVTMRCENKIYQKWHSLRKSIRMYKTIPEFNRQFMISVSLGLIIGSFITYMLIILNNSHRRITAGPSIDPDSSLPSIALHGVKEDQEYLWGKTKEAFRYVYKHYLDKADWFLKADDDTYVIVENLRYMLMPYNSSDPIYFGCRFKPYVNQGYMSGGAGYVLSREAVKRFVEISLRNATGCRIHENYGPEDLEIGRCLESAQVKAGDSRDSLGRNRFLPLFPQRHLIPGEMWEETPWYWIYMYYKGEEGMWCCSDNAVSFHYIDPNEMYELEYLIYHLRPYGISFNMVMPPELLDKEIDQTSRSDKLTVDENSRLMIYDI